MNQRRNPGFITAVFINPVLVDYFFLSTWFAAN